MSYLYAQRKKAIKRAKKKHADDLIRGKLPSGLMPKGVEDQPIGSLAELMS